MSKFTPVNEKEYKERNIWPNGWYAATAVDSTERLSSNNNLMFETKWEVYHDDGRKRIITSYILAEGKAAFQLRAAAEALGCLEEYRNAKLNENDLKGKSCFVKLITDQDKEEKFPAKNVISDYRKTMPGTVKAADIQKPKPQTKKQTEEDLSDGIPF